MEALGNCPVCPLLNPALLGTFEILIIIIIIFESTRRRIGQCVSFSFTEIVLTAVFDVDRTLRGRVNQNDTEDRDKWRKYLRAVWPGVGLRTATEQNSFRRCQRRCPFTPSDATRQFCRVESGGVNWS